MPSFFAKGIRLALAILLLAPTAAVAALPYDENADAHHELMQALADAQSGNKKVLMIFGANWCPTCRELDYSIRSGKTPIDRRKFAIIKIDVGNFDKNLDISRAYGNPIKKGIPAAVVLTADRRVVYRGSLSNFLMPHRRLLKIGMAGVTLLLAIFAAWVGIVFLQRRNGRMNNLQPDSDAFILK